MGIYFLAVNLCDKNMRDGVKDTLRSGLEQVGDAKEQLPLTQTNRVIDAGKREESYMDVGHRRARAQFAVGAVKDVVYSGKHEFRLAEMLISFSR
jgi:hypothetical protein